MVAYPEAGESGPGDRGLAERGERCECHLRFSIVIPAYNEEAFIGATLKSLLAQDFADPYEIVVVDNNSSDETAWVAMAHGAIVVREERQGVCWVRQRGTGIAAGEIIVSADADTVYGTGWLSRIDPEFRKDSGCVAVVGPFRFADAPWYGRVAFIPDNPVLTSSRRLSRGFIYNAIVTVFFYYFLGYTLNRLTRRPVVGMAPAFRAAGDSHSLQPYPDSHGRLGRASVRGRDSAAGSHRAKAE